METAKKSDAVEATLESLRLMSTQEPERYKQILIDLERAMRGESLQALDLAVRSLTQATRAEVLRRLASGERGSYNATDESNQSLN